MKESAIIQLILTLATVLGGGAAMVGWAYETFEVKDAARERLVTQERRLERIEAKIDSLSERLAGPQRERH